jgi:hypothetical protein
VPDRRRAELSTEPDGEDKRDEEQATEEAERDDRQAAEKDAMLAAFMSGDGVGGGDWAEARPARTGRAVSRLKRSGELLGCVFEKHARAYLTGYTDDEPGRRSHATSAVREAALAWVAKLDECVIVLQYKTTCVGTDVVQLMILAHGHRWPRADEHWLLHLISRFKRACRRSYGHTSVHRHLRGGQLVVAGVTAIV